MGAKEFTGKSVQDAIKIGLEELGVGIDEVNIEILNEGTGGLFGIGAKKAQIRITPLDEDYTPSTPADDDEDEGVMSSVVKSAAKNLEASLEKEAKKAEAAESGNSNKEVSEQHIKCVTDFLDGLFKNMGVECTYDIKTRGNEITVNIKSNDSGKIIGHRGDTLDAIQYLTRLVLHKQDLPYASVIVQTENYREKREQTLKALASRLANKVERTGRRVTLEPMKPYERRIIHEALQNNPAVTTESQGEEPNRFVVIKPASN